MEEEIEPCVHLLAFLEALRGLSLRVGYESPPPADLPKMVIGAKCSACEVVMVLRADSDADSPQVGDSDGSDVGPGRVLN